MRPTAPDQAAALAPVRSELLRAAHEEADALLSAADGQAAATLARARATAEAVLAQARREGEADAARSRAAELTRARRDARAAHLAVRRQAYEELRRHVTDQVLRLRYADGCPALRDRLTEHARRLLGPDARIVEDPGGGVVAHAPGRRADLTLGAFAARALDRAGGEAEALWTP
ncbi:hypothetical protein [Streptomyces sp. NBC_01262]|uniref:hypothetical protein n=1 Tax=Streptomyces sp. NBC_01262 TaxID=2903803 RepID=UPI002E366F8F|nr:hypothetical protein [Streptomyces sp. NBC_01262]